jgi:hypothetical protein
MQLLIMATCLLALVCAEAAAATVVRIPVPVPSARASEETNRQVSSAATCPANRLVFQSTERSERFVTDDYAKFEDTVVVAQLSREQVWDD